MWLEPELRSSCLVLAQEGISLTEPSSRQIPLASPKLPGPQQSRVLDPGRTAKRVSSGGVVLPVEGGSSSLLPSLASDRPQHSESTCMPLPWKPHTRLHPGLCEVSEPWLCGSGTSAVQSPHQGRLTKGEGPGTCLTQSSGSSEPCAVMWD